MTHSLSLAADESPPAMCRKATLAMLVSSTSMNVGTVTTTATSHGLTACRPIDEAEAGTARLISGSRRGHVPQAGPGRRPPLPVLLELAPRVRPGRALLVADVGHDRKAQEEGRFL